LVHFITGEGQGATLSSTQKHPFHIRGGSQGGGGSPPSHTAAAIHLTPGEGHSRGGSMHMRHLARSQPRMYIYAHDTSHARNLACTYTPHPYCPSTACAFAMEGHSRGGSMHMTPCTLATSHTHTYTTSLLSKHRLRLRNGVCCRSLRSGDGSAQSAIDGRLPRAAPCLARRCARGADASPQPANARVSDKRLEPCRCRRQ
jgi:hypothetical protein